MNTDDNGIRILVAAAAQAAGPCAPGGEAAWGRRVREMAVELALIAADVAQDTRDLAGARPFTAILEKTEIEETSRRGLLTLRTPEGGTETIRTQPETTDRGQALIRRAQTLEGHWVLIWKHTEPMAGSKTRTVRVLAHIMDLGDRRTLPAAAAKTMVLEAAGGDKDRARRAWTDAGLPDAGAVSAELLEKARAAARETAGPPAGR